MAYPIDLVIPMVFPQDDIWQADYAFAHGMSAVKARGNVRFRSWDNERLLILLCRKNMPWLRKIHILLAGESQVQQWMKEMKSAESAADNGGKELLPSLNIVFHRDFIHHSLLPCFNVNTIEMHLHKIPDLAEHFIYSNDDFFPLSPLNPEDFFRLANGDSCAERALPCQQCKVRPYPDKPNIFHKFVKNGLDMIAADFGKRFTDTWLRTGHSMQPMLRSTVESVCTVHADRIGKSFTLSRSPENFNQYIFPFWQHLSGQYIDHMPRHTYLGLMAATEDIVRHLRTEDPGIVCINDNGGIQDWEERARIVKQELTRRT